MVASVPITSSASKPGASSMGMRQAPSMSFIIGTARLMSSGVASRCALYSGKASWRKVGPGGSNATPTCVGLSLASTSWSVLTKPIMAEVLRPLEFTRGLLMKA